MIFMHLRTSTNYDDEEKKLVGGKNGFGIKLVFILSVTVLKIFEFKAGFPDRMERCGLMINLLNNLIYD